MASVVDICNLALAHLGDPAQVTAIRPPDGSVQAARCARFYPVARRIALTPGWGFNLRRGTAADLSDPVGAWGYRYQKPSAALRVLKVLSPYSESHEPSAPFVMETDASGSETILTNQAQAVVLYSVDEEDTTKFTPIFESALSWLLASYLAGPIIKGKAGASVASAAMQRFTYELSMAAALDGAQHKTDRADVKPSGIKARQ